MPATPVPDLAMSIRNALIGEPTVVSLLPLYKPNGASVASPTVFTRRPVPPDAPYPMIVVSGNIVKIDNDGVSDSRPQIDRDIAIYGQNDTATQYRTVVQIADAVYALFHHDRTSITLVSADGWTLTDIHCRGPIEAPSDDEIFAARVVTMTITLANAKS